MPFDVASPGASESLRSASEQPLADAGDVFVGRERELARLDGAFRMARAGAGRLALLVGEPGIGKTRTVLEFAHRARRAHALVLGGRCYEGGGTPAFWPWIQILRECVARRDGDPVNGGPHAATLGQLLPELRERSRDVAPSAPTSPATRFRFFDSFCALLKTLASRQPVVLVLEDLHCADVASLQLLTFLGGELATAAILVVVTYRDSEVPRGHPLVDTIVEVGRHRDVLRVPLNGLSETEVAQLLGFVVGRTAGVDLVRVMQQLTDGNPFFVIELMRFLVDAGCLDDWKRLLKSRVVVPRSVRDVIRRRRAGLSAPCDDLLVAAAVLGREFAVPVLQHLCRLPPESVLGLLEEAVERGIVAEAPERASRFRFTHALVREAIYDDIGHAARCGWHRRAGETLEALQAERVQPRWDKVAHHYAQCAFTAGSPEVRKAIDYSLAAGRQALALMAYEDAAEHFQRALQLIDDMTPLEPGRDKTSCEVLLALGDAYDRAGDPERARASFRRAADLARGSTLPSHFARAALGLAGQPVVSFEIPEPLIRALLEEALRVLPDEDSTLRAQVMCRLAFELRSPSTRACRIRLSEEALAMGRRLRDLQTLSLVLSERRIRLVRTAGLVDRLAEDDGLVRLAQEACDVEAEVQARGWRVLDLLEFGAIAAVDEEIHAFASLANVLRHPIYLSRMLGHRTTRAILDGNLDDAEALAAEYFALARRVVEFQALAAFSAQVAMLRRLRGGLTEIVPAVESLVERNPGLAAARAGLAVLYAELDRPEDARRQFERLAVGDFVDLPDDYFWPGTVAYLAEACASLGDVPRAGVLYDLLSPLADRTIVIGLGGCWGSAARFLGILASTLRRWDAAIRHFEDALSMNRRLGARPFVALTEQAYAAALLERGEPGDRERAIELIASVVRAARQLGMRSVLEATLQLSRRVDRPGRGGTPVPETGRPRTGNGRQSTDLEAARPELLFRRDGEFFCIGEPATAFRLKDSLGLRYLAQLLAHPQHTFCALDLAASVQGGQPPPAREGNGDMLLDQRARTAYRARLAELGEDLDEAVAQNDEGRAMRLRAETEILTRELVRSTGLGGRGRRIAGPAERARVNVTRTIRDAIRRITAHDAAIGRHLATKVRTGTFCTYDPGVTATIQWLG